MKGIIQAAKEANGRSQTCNICPVLDSHKVCPPEFQRVRSDSFIRIQERSKIAAKAAEKRIIMLPTIKEYSENFFENLRRINATKNGQCGQCKHFHRNKGKRNTCSKDPFSFDNGWEYVPYRYKAKDRACSEFEYRDDLIWMQNKIVDK